jgi:hypothetical protein
MQIFEKQMTKFVKNEIYALVTGSRVLHTLILLYLVTLTHILLFSFLLYLRAGHKFLHYYASKKLIYTGVIVDR